MSLTFGAPQKSADDGVGNLVLDDVGTPVPAGINDDLRVRKIGDRVQGHALHRLESAGDKNGRRDQDECFIARGKLDDPGDHDA